MPLGSILVIGSDSSYQGPFGHQVVSCIVQLQIIVLIYFTMIIEVQLVKKEGRKQLFLNFNTLEVEKLVLIFNTLKEICDAIWENLSDVAKWHFEKWLEIVRKLVYNSIEVLNII